MTGEELDAEARVELRTLPKDLAARVARHLVMAGRLVDEDPATAYKHARAARRLASRVGLVREAAGFAAYHAGEWADALAELRAARRLRNSDEAYLPIMADSERGLGRPERALDLAKSPEARRLDQEEKIELRIVESGARRDLGQYEAAVVTLQIPELKDKRLRPWSARLFYAYADALLEAGRETEASDWFARAAAADRDGETDAAERYAELEGLEIVDTETVADVEAEDSEGIEQSTSAATLPAAEPQTDVSGASNSPYAEQDGMPPSADETVGEAGSYDKRAETASEQDRNASAVGGSVGETPAGAESGAGGSYARSPEETQDLSRTASPTEGPVGGETSAGADSAATGPYGEPGESASEERGDARTVDALSPGPEGEAGGSYTGSPEETGDLGGTASPDDGPVGGETSTYADGAAAGPYGDRGKTASERRGDAPPATGTVGETPAGEAAGSYARGPEETEDLGGTASPIEGAAGDETSAGTDGAAVGPYDERGETASGERGEVSPSDGTASGTPADTEGEAGGSYAGSRQDTEELGGAAPPNARPAGDETSARADSAAAGSYGGRGGTTSEQDGNESPVAGTVGGGAPAGAAGGSYARSPYETQDLSETASPIDGPVGGETSAGADSAAVGPYGERGETASEEHGDTPRGARAAGGEALAGAGIPDAEGSEGIEEHAGTPPSVDRIVSGGPTAGVEGPAAGWYAEGADKKSGRGKDAPEKTPGDATSIGTEGVARGSYGGSALGAAEQGEDDPPVGATPEAAARSPYGENAEKTAERGSGAGRALPSEGTASAESPTGADSVGGSAPSPGADSAQGDAEYRSSGDPESAHTSEGGETGRAAEDPEGALGPDQGASGEGAGRPLGKAGAVATPWGTATEDDEVATPRIPPSPPEIAVVFQEPVLEEPPAEDD